MEDFSLVTQVGRSFEGADGVSRVVVRQVYNFQVPHWRVRTRTRIGKSVVTVK